MKQAFWSRISEKWLVALLALLGFGLSACDTDHKVEYGAPTGTYIVRGTARSAETQSPLENIQVRVLVRNYDGTYLDFGDNESRIGLITKSLEDGGFRFEWENAMYGNILEFSDPEQVKTDTLEFSYDDIEYTGGDGRWNFGTGTLSLGDIYLDPPAEVEEEPAAE